MQYTLVSFKFFLAASASAAARSSARPPASSNVFLFFALHAFPILSLSASLGVFPKLVKLAIWSVAHVEMTSPSISIAASLFAFGNSSGRPPASSNTFFAALLQALTAASILKVAEELLFADTHASRVFATSIACPVRLSFSKSDGLPPLFSYVALASTSHVCAESPRFRQLLRALLVARWAVFFNTAAAFFASPPMAVSSFVASSRHSVEFVEFDLSMQLSNTSPTAPSLARPSWASISSGSTPFIISSNSASPLQ